MLFDFIPDTRKRYCENGCIEWTGPLNNNGRPRVTIFGKPLFRVLCWEEHGPPEKGRFHAAHTCHNKICINPKHSEWQEPEVNNPRMPHSEEVLSIPYQIKRRKSSKGGGRKMEGWCASFNYEGKRYKSGAYYSVEAARRWVVAKIHSVT